MKNSLFPAAAFPLQTACCSQTKDIKAQTDSISTENTTSSSLGLSFYTNTKSPSKYRGGAFTGQQGSWNISELAGYKVFFATAATKDSALPVADNLSGKTWRVTAK